MAKRQQGKFWCFTENTDPDQFRINLEDLYQNSLGRIHYICGQLEQGEHRHFQGYIQLDVSRALSWLKRNVSATAHFEIQRGNTEQARDYCHKEDATTITGTFVECGEYKQAGAGAGERTDLIALRDAIIEGKSQRDIIEQEDLVETYAKYLKFHDRVRSLYRPKPREEGVKVILHYGDPGTGKTRRVFESDPDVFEIPITNGTLWFDGYDGQETVLFDDFLGAASKMSLDNTLKFLDRYVRQVPIKGAYIWYRPRVIHVTTNYHPRCWYKWTDREESWKALKRRIHEIWVYERLNEPYEVYPQDFLEDKEYWPRNEEHIREK